MTTAERLRALDESGTGGRWYGEGRRSVYSRVPLSGSLYSRVPLSGDICVADIDSGGILDPEDTTKIVTAVNLLGAVAELVEACEQPGHFADKWGCAECGWAWPCPTECALAAVREVLGS